MHAPQSIPKRLTCHQGSDGKSDVNCPIWRGLSLTFLGRHIHSTLLHWCNWYLFIPVLLPIPTEFGLSEPQPKAQETVILIGLFEQVFGSSQLIDGHPEFQHSSRPRLPVFGNIYISPLCFKRCFVASLQPSRKNNGQ